MSIPPSALTRKNRAILELAATSAIWGFGFITVIWALELMTPLWLSTARHWIAIALALPLIAILPGQRKQVTSDLIRASFAPGATLAFALVLQTWGLKYTSATKSGFITTLYIFFVPIGVALFYKLMPSLIHWICVFIALLGTALMCNFHTDTWNIGDIMTLAAAVGMAAQILMIDREAGRFDSPFLFNVFQSVWAAVVTLPFALIFEGTSALADWDMVTAHPKAWVSILFLAWASTLLAFGIQVRAQRDLPPTLASLLFLLESPFAALFAYLCLNETLNTAQWGGGFLILGSAVVASLFSKNK